MPTFDESFALSNPGTKPPLAKEQMTAFQRWELASFDPIPEVRPAAIPVSPAAQLDAIKLAADEAQKLHQFAYDEGYAQGQQAGYAAGLAIAQGEREILLTITQNLQTALTQIDEQLAQSLLDLSLEIAHKMVVAALQVKPELILKIVSTAIGNLPHFNQNAHLILHPQDAELVRKQMGEQLGHAGWKIFTDERIEPGGCRLETAHSNVDATNPSRWQCIVESIGQDKSWLT